VENGKHQQKIKKPVVGATPQLHTLKKHKEKKKGKKNEV